MKVIFLDIDGVLNFAGTEARAPGGCLGIAEPCVKRLRRIVDNTGAKIVLTSTWKDEWCFDESSCSAMGIYLVKKLKRHGMHILDKTKDHVDNRGEGIIEWLQRHDNVRDWIVLDDDTFRDYDRCGIMPRFIHTSFANGLQDEHVQSAIKLLNENDE